MMASAIKFLHVAAISLWAAGLICFPFLVRQRNDAGTMTDLHRLHSMARYFYIVILSPGAFVAIGSGIALIFVRQTFTEWFSIKLLFVGLLAVIHLLTGRVILRSFEKEATVAAWQFPAMTAATLAVVTAIVAVVLAKPQFDWRVEQGLLAPGGLGAAFEKRSISIVDHQADAVIEHELAAVPSRKSREDRGENGERESVRQHLIGCREPQAPIGAGDGEQRHRCDGVRPATDATANAFYSQQFGGSDQSGEYAEAEREPGTPNAGAQEERIALHPIEHVDAQRGEH